MVPWVFPKRKIVGFFDLLDSAFKRTIAQPLGARPPQKKKGGRGPTREQGGLAEYAAANSGSGSGAAGRAFFADNAFKLR